MRTRNLLRGGRLDVFPKPRDRDIQRKFCFLEILLSSYYIFLQRQSIAGIGHNTILCTFLLIKNKNPCCSGVLIIQEHLKRVIVSKPKILIVNIDFHFMRSTVPCSFDCLSCSDRTEKSLYPSYRTEKCPHSSEVSVDRQERIEIQMDFMPPLA